MIRTILNSAAGIAICALALSLAACGGEKTAGVDDEATTAFADLAQEYLNWRYEAMPTWATAQGMHDYDGMLPDMSLAAQEEQNAAVKNFAARLAEIDPAKLSNDDAVDYDILRNHFEREQFRYERLGEGRRNPMNFIGIATGSVYGLIKRDFAPLEERLSSAISRMQGIPALLAQAREALDNPPQIYTEVAIGQNAGAVNFFRSVLPPMAEGTAVAEEFATACEAAAVELEGFGEWLKSDLLSRSGGDWRIGAENYDEYLPILLNTDLTADDVLQRAEERFAEKRALVLKLCTDNWSYFYPDAGMPDDPEERMRKVFDVIAGSHTTADNVIQQVKDDVVEIKTFIADKEVIPLPEPDRLEVIEMPRFEAGRAMAYNDQPPSLEPQGRSFYAVTPFLEHWDADYIESFLREYNDRMLKILTIHEAYPGHFVQGWYAAKSPSLLRKIFDSGSFAEGWAMYIETAMLEKGFGEGDPGFEIQRWKWLMRAIANAIIDQKLHKGLMTDEELVTFLMEQAFQERTEAEAKLTRAKLSYGQLATYFVGYEEHMDLREDYRAMAGDNFNLSDYHVAVVSHGGPPIRLLRRLILEN